MKKRISGILYSVLFSLVFSFPSFAYVIGDVNGDNKVGLAEAINALQLTSGLRSAAAAGATINVPGQGLSIQQAINAAAPGDTINVAAGTYTETLVIGNKALAIQGAGSGSTAIGGIAGQDVLTIDSGRVIISGVTVQGGLNGLYAKRGAVVEISDVIVQDVAGKGVYIDQSSTAKLTNITARRCTDYGIFVYRNSGVVFSGVNESSNSQSTGIVISDSSSASLIGATLTVTNNYNYGLSVTTNSGLIADGSSITTTQNNKGNVGGMGIISFGGSSIRLQNSSSLLSDNGGFDGLGVGSASSFYVDTTSTVTARNSIRYGINLWSNANAALYGPVLVEKNGGNTGVGGSGGIDVAHSSNVFIAYNTVTIQDNINNGLWIYASSLYMDQTGKLIVKGTSGNGTGIGLQLNATLGIGGNLLVQNNAGSGINASDGSRVMLNPNSPNTGVIQNNNIGINVWDGAVHNFVAGTLTITNNTTKDINLSFGSKAAMTANSYGTCSMDSSSMGLTCQ